MHFASINAIGPDSLSATVAILKSETSILHVLYTVQAQLQLQRFDERSKKTVGRKQRRIIRLYNKTNQVTTVKRHICSVRTTWGSINTDKDDPRKIVCGSYNKFLGCHPLGHFGKARKVTSPQSYSLLGSVQTTNWSNCQGYYQKSAKREEQIHFFFRCCTFSL